MPLFHDLPAVQEYRRIAWLYRIDLLRDWGRLTEALAWTCLECELHPENMAAQVLKDLLKESLHLGVKLPGEASGAPPKNVATGIWPGVAGMREVKALTEERVPHRSRQRL